MTNTMSVKVIRAPLLAESYTNPLSPDTDTSNATPGIS